MVKGLLFRLNNSRDRWMKALVFILLLVLVVVVFWQKTDLSNSDLGRHIQNGRLVLSEPSVLYTNFYSYSEPNHSFVNHHWLSGVIYNLLNNIGGFKLLTLFNILLALLSFSIFFLIAYRRSNFYTSAILSLPVIFLLSERIEVRPEMFSYLFFGLTWLALENRKLSNKKRLYILFPIFVLWVNIHIFFFLGLALVFFYSINKIIKETGKDDFCSWQRIRKTAIFYKEEIGFFCLLVLSTIINPSHIRGLLYPFNILRKYGYQIAENKSIFFLDDLMLNHNFWIFKLLLFLLLLSLIANYLLLKKKTWSDWLLAIMISTLALVMSRNLSFFALVALVLISPSASYGLRFIFSGLDYIFSSLKAKYNWRIFAYILFILILLSTFIFLVTDLNKRQLFLHQDPGLGLTEDSMKAFEYYRENNLEGPIFNNYDAGSAIIYGLYDREKVFVDNRPEAYSVSFFKETYIPMQENSLIWENRLDEYGFKTIIFAHTDSRPWAKAFMNRIFADSNWALVYFDRYYIILVNRQEYLPEFITPREINETDFRYFLREQADSQYLNAKFNLANLAEIVNYNFLAKEIYQKIIFSHPYNHRAIFSLAYIYAGSTNRADLFKAIDYLERSLSISPNMPGIYKKIGLVYWQLNDYDQAEEYFEKARKNGDKDAKDYLIQIEVLKRRGKIN